MPVTTREDRFANMASASVQEAIAGTMKYTELLTGISFGAGIGLLIDKVSYQIGFGTLGNVSASGDVVQCGWFTAKNAIDFDFNDRRLIDSVAFGYPATIGTPASNQQHTEMPVVHDFSPPLIIATPRLFLGIKGLNLAGVADAVSRFYFRYQPLSDKEYLELAETFVLVG